ncbi:hypothetical protein [Paraburkholderia sp. J8-2]|uniref:hypothetical protein n=1 Tax=Paraburkholderia sp. J8-2 TaxID=2805440 RepID=UPI002AB776B7|nr:hypothetical protein [Paraburkholderia sp. J8-2]
MSKVTSSSRAITRARYALRVQSIADGELAYDVSIDDVRRFRIEVSHGWPVEWRLYATTDASCARQPIAIENEYFDILDQLERGEHWMPADSIERPVAAPTPITYVRFPEYQRGR